MKRTVFIYLCGLVAFLTFYACGSSDSGLQKEVNSVMIAYPGVTANVNKGVVTLTGTVASQDMKSGAERAAGAIRNIKSVTNNIVVNTPAAPAPSSMGVNSDNTLNETITNSLKAGGYDDVNVSVMDGEVTLTGKVKRDNLQKVMQIANEASPKRVINQMEIE